MRLPSCGVVFRDELGYETTSGDKEQRQAEVAIVVWDRTNMVDSWM